MLRENNTLLNNKVRLASILSNLSTIHSQEQINSSFKKAILNSSHLSCDSREIIENSTFIAIKGETYNGHAFIPKLLATNCLIIADEKENEILAKKIKEKSHQLKPNCQKAKIIFVKDTKAFATKYASVFYDHPSRQLKVVGITGTNGKTTSAYFLKHLYQEIGLSTGLIGTIEISYGDKCLVNPNTTPEPVKLQRHLFEMKAAGVEVVIMEISSHALALNRVDGLHLDSVIFTNITQDHLDFHKNKQQYLNAKLLIFDLLALSSKKNKQVSIWSKTDYFPYIINRIQQHHIPYRTFDLGPGASMQAKINKLELGSMDCCITLNQNNSEQVDFNDDFNNGEVIINNSLPLIGEYNLLNLMGCLCEFIGSGYYRQQNRDEFNPLEPLVLRVLKLAKIPGRVEAIENNKGALIIVDYAHTPDALKNIIGSLKKLPHTRLITLFGCGGDRDNSKRSQMGRVVGKHCDFAFITSDNPRTEKPKDIIDMIVPGIKETGGSYTVIEDRELAIKAAVTQVKQNDILLIAGKGHESYQILGKEKIHFDDREITQKYLS